MRTIRVFAFVVLFLFHLRSTFLGIGLERRCRLNTVYCSNCGRESRGTERFCADCGNRLESNPVPQNFQQNVSESNSFENLIAVRVRQARKRGATPITTKSDIQSSQQSQDTLGSSMNSKKLPFLFSITTFVVGLLAMIAGYFIFPFSYVIDSAKSRDWVLLEISSLLIGRSDEGYIFGPALSFLVGGFLLTILLAIMITVIVIVAARKMNRDQSDFDVKRMKILFFLILLGRTTSVLMSLLFTWQLTGMWTLQRAADTQGGLGGDDGYSYFSLGFGSVLSLLGIVAFAFAGASMTNRATVERNV